MSPAESHPRPPAVHFGLLTLITLGSLGAIMLSPQVAGQRIGVQVLVAVPLVTGVYLAGRHTRLLLIATVALIIASITGVLAAAHHDASLLALDAGIRAAITVVVAAWAMREVLRAPRVSFDTISGAICAYLLFGFVYSNVFLMLETLAPGSLLEGGRPLPSISPIFYFSYVTLTTVAYGDIAPVSAAARFVAMTEGMVGQLFPTIIIARLVSLNVAQMR